MRLALIGTTCLFAMAAVAQEAAKPAITVDELMEKSIQATGGREVASKMTSLVAKGTIEIVAMGVTANTEIYSKAPNKRATFTVIDGYGDIRQAFDGTIGWSSEPQNGLVELKGTSLARARRDAQFNGELRWKEFGKNEIVGKEKVGGRDCWAVKLTVEGDKPIMRYYDAETFLLSKVVMTMESQGNEAEVPIELSDWKDIGNGHKSAYTTKLTLPGIGELVTRLKDFQVNADIDDAKFAKPKN